MKKSKFQKISRLITAFLITICPFMPITNNLNSVKAASTFALILAIDPLESGTISGYKNNDPSQTIISGEGIALHTPIHITATPENGYVFDHWEFNPGGTSPNYVTGGIATNNLSLEMPDMPITATAHFIEATDYRLTFEANPSGSGTVSGHKNNNPSQTIISGDKIEFNTQVTLTATPETGYVFDRWEFPEGFSNFTTQGEQVIFTIHEGQSINITAHFKLKEYNLNLEIDSTESGIIKDEKGNVVTPGSMNYTLGSQINFTAEPKDGYKFTKWTGDYVSNHDSKNLQFGMPNHNVKLIAVFEKEDKEAILKTSDDFNISPYVKTMILFGALYFLLKNSNKKVAKI